MHRGAIALAATLLLGLGLAGCTSGPEYRLHGHFTAEPRPDWAEFDAIMIRHTGSTVPIMESFPEQFAVAGLSLETCQALRAELLTLPYIDSVSECMRVQTVDDPDEPVTDEPEPQQP